mmetsp:Transcript_46609/g.110839  ORF Transcript_46609/g.110839 Transcript_46609/m.110839 type:complete len:265 (+) Transcript_46609:104-898(+)
MSYSQGVLIHNFNEDRYGVDLVKATKPPEPAAVSISHTVHGWKQPSPQASVQDARAMQSVERHILFGHTGDMRDPHTNLQKAEYATASQYFLQDPKQVGPVGSLTADRFTLSEDPIKVSKAAPSTSMTAARARERWGTGIQSHALPSDERFTTTHMVSFPKSRLSLQSLQRMGHGRGLEGSYDSAILSRSQKDRAPNPLTTASQMMLDKFAAREAEKQATQVEPLVSPQADERSPLEIVTSPLTEGTIAASSPDTQQLQQVGAQ